MRWIYLIVAITGEVIGTSALKYSEGFTKFLPSVVVVVGYSVTFYFLSLSLKYIPLGVAYAVWGGVGILLISLIGYFVFKQSFDIPGVIGIALIMAGVITINLFSKMASH